MRTIFIVSEDLAGKACKYDTCLASEVNEKDKNIKYINCDGITDINDLDLIAKNSVSRYINKFLDNLERNERQEVIKTGFDNFDKNLGGGIYPGLYCIGAISSLGKTALSLQIADNVASSGQHVLFFSLEMPIDELISRTISRELFIKDFEKWKHAGTRSILMNKIHGNDFNEVLSIYENSIAKNLTIVDTGFNTKVTKICEKIKNFVNLTGLKPLVMIDYLQVIKPELKAGYSDKQAIDDIVVKLKMLSRELNLPIFIISSFNRQNYSTHVNFECFKESGCIEYTCDVVMGLQLSVLDNPEIENAKNKNEYIRSAKEKEAREITLVTLKNRNGKAYTKTKMIFYARNNLFKESNNTFDEITK